VQSLSEGWNLVSLPFNQSVDKNDMIVKTDGYYYSWSDGVVSDFVFGWDKGTQSYNFASTLEPGEGYWVYSYEDCELWIENITILPEDPYITQLEAGWNIVGVPHNENVSKDNILVDEIPWDDAVTGGIINDIVFGWNRAGQSYTFADTFMPGYAYWMYAYQPCTLKRAI